MAAPRATRGRRKTTLGKVNLEVNLVVRSKRLSARHNARARSKQVILKNYGRRYSNAFVCHANVQKTNFHLDKPTFSTTDNTSCAGDRSTASAAVSVVGMLPGSTVDGSDVSVFVTPSIYTAPEPTKRGLLSSALKKGNAESVVLLEMATEDEVGEDAAAIETRLVAGGDDGGACNLRFSCSRRLIEDVGSERAATRSPTA